MKIILHVNYHEGPGKLDGLIGLALKYGYDGVELRGKYRFPDMTQKEYMNHVAGLKSAHPELEMNFSGMVDYCRGSADEVKNAEEEVLENMEFYAKECGCKLMNFFTGVMIDKNRPDADNNHNGSGLADEGDYLRAAAGLKTIGAKARSLGMLAALETHNGYLHDCAASCRKLMDLTQSDPVGINYDHGNLFYRENAESVDQVFESIGDKIYYAHLKNVLRPKGLPAKSGIPCRLSDGHIDTRYVLQKLGANLRSGMVAVEFPCPGDRIYAARQDIAYIRTLLEDLGI